MQISSDSSDPIPASLFDRLGGEAGIRRLVDAFYDRMDRDADYRGIRDLHPPTLEGSRDKFFWFLCGWSGGPDLFVQRFGHPRLRARHMPYAIGLSERDQWLRCMYDAIVEIDLDPDLAQGLMQSFLQTADWMRNQTG